MKNKLSLTILLCVISFTINAQGWGNYDGNGNYVNNNNSVRSYRYGNHIWNGPELFYCNNGSCDYTQVPIQNFPLLPCDTYGRQLYTRRYQNNNWVYDSYNSAPFWFWVATAATNTIIDVATRPRQQRQQSTQTYYVVPNNNVKVIYIQNQNKGRNNKQKYDADGDPIWNP